MITPGLLVFAAAILVLVQAGIAYWTCMSVGKAERRVMARIDELNRLVSALTRKVELESEQAMQALDETRQLQMRGLR